MYPRQPQASIAINKSNVNSEYKNNYAPKNESLWASNSFLYIRRDGYDEMATKREQDNNRGYRNTHSERLFNCRFHSSV